MNLARIYDLAAPFYRFFLALALFGLGKDT